MGRRGNFAQSGLKIWKKEQSYVDRAYEVLVAHENVGHGETEDDGQHPRADEPLYGLFRRKFNELRAAEGDAADIRKNVIGDDQ